MIKNIQNYLKMKWYILGAFKGGKIDVLDIIDGDELNAEILTQEMKCDFPDGWKIWNDNNIEKYKEKLRYKEELE